LNYLNKQTLKKQLYKWAMQLIWAFSCLRTSTN